jgi:hypothetical protein
MSADSKLKEAVAARRGLDQRAARFLAGETIEQLEESASLLATLIGERESEEPPSARGPDLLADAAEIKAAKKDALLAALTGKGSQARDDRGRFTASASSSFDGGARQPAKTRHPEREHGKLIAQMAALSRTFRGG